MSLLFRRRQIARAVLGELPPAAEDRLRAHLRGCDACRGYYDRLSGAAEMVTAATARRAAARERLRLERSLPAAATGEAGSATPARETRSRRPWLILGVVLAPAAALVVWFGLPSPSPRDAPEQPPASDTGLRGAAEPDGDTASGPALIVYASRRTGTDGRAPLRLVGELPGSGTVTVSRADYLQFGVRGLSNAAAVSIRARGESGATHVFLPRAGGPAPQAEAGTRATVVGPSFDLARAPAAGRYTLTARFSRAAPGERDDSGAMDAPAVEVSGLLVIEP